MSLSRLLWKDARVDARGKEALQAGLVLVGLFLLVDVLAVADLSTAPRTAAIVLWTPLAFAAATALGRTFAAEHDRGTLDWVRTAPVPAAWHGLSRTLVHLPLMAALAAATLLAAGGLFGVPLGADLVLVVALSALGLTIVGTLVGALAAQARAREALLPILLLPAAAPLLQAGIHGTMAALADAPTGSALLLLSGYDLAAAGLAWLLWPAVLEADA